MLTVQELRAKLNLSPSEFSELIGLKKSAYYNKINGDNDWTLPELIRMCELNKGGLDIELNGVTYRITAKKR